MLERSEESRCYLITNHRHCAHHLRPESIVKWLAVCSIQYLIHGKLTLVPFVAILFFTHRFLAVSTGLFKTQTFVFLATRLLPCYFIGYKDVWWIVTPFLTLEWHSTVRVLGSETIMRYICLPRTKAR
jgi:hypothetical protein